MTARRRKWSIVVSLLVVVVAAGWYFARSGGTLEVKLLFVGITNGPDGTTHALVLATNSGSSKLLLYGRGADYGPSALEPVANLQFKSPYFSPFDLPDPGKVFPAQLLPGQTIQMSIPFTRLDEPMEAGLSATRYQWQDRLYCRTMSSCNRFLTTLAGRFLSQPPSRMPTLDVVTNLPPQIGALHPPRVARP